MSETAEQKPQQPMMSGWPARLIWLLAIGLAAAAAYRWHAIHWGQWVWFAAFIVMSMLRAPHAATYRKNTIVDDRNDRPERIVLAAMFATMMVLPLFYLATPFLSFADYTLPNWATAIGAAVQVPCLWLFWRSHADLGRNWSPGLEVRVDHGLVTNGVYRSIRHPMYAAIWLSVLAQPLLLQNWIGGALVVPAFLAMWVIRIPKEEAMMRAQFGQVYDDYAARTGRVFPRLTAR